VAPPPPARGGGRLTTASPRSAAGAKTLPGAYYTSAEIYRRELEKLFFGGWIYAGHRSALPEKGSRALLEIDGESVLLVRDGEGSARAFYNVCRHRGSRLCTEESIEGKASVRCPYHAWTYALDGALLAAPNMDEVTGFDRADYPLRSIPLAEWQGFLFISLGMRPEPFERHLAALAGKFTGLRLAELERVHRKTYDVAANWKLFFQNYNECYHCPTAHPLLNRLTPYRQSHNEFGEGAVLGGPMDLIDPDGSMTMTGQRCAPPLGGDRDGVDSGLPGRVYYYSIFPNLFLSVHPDYVLVHRIEPLAVDRTRVVCDWLFDPEAVAADAFDPEPAIGFWDLTNTQDWELCTLAQLGVSSRGYVPGPYSEMENQPAGFDREYLRVLEEEGEGAR
jgi:phenylpropionate dioxygenase-like ring-hydroxylating dioxygenase large terminal subunit